MANVIAEVFRKVVGEALVKQAERAVQALTNQAPFQNEVLAADPTQAPDPLDSAAVHRYFDRTELQQLYRDQIEKPKGSKVSTAIAAKIQSDLLSQAERDFRTQHSVTRVRSLMLAASREAAMADPEGPVTRGLAHIPEQLLKLDGGTA